MVMGQIVQYCIEYGNWVIIPTCTFVQVIIIIIRGYFTKDNIINLLWPGPSLMTEKAAENQRIVNTYSV